MSARIQTINALAELERNGIPFEPIGDDEVRLKCPVHSDDTPSVNLNVQKNIWICHAAQCKAKGDIIALLGYFLQAERSLVILDLAKRYDLEEIKTINPRLIEKYNAGIKEAGPLLVALRERGITDEDIRIHRLGFNQGRITIPVYDAQGRIVNCRRYLPGAPGPEKMQNAKGYGDPKIYGIDQFAKYDKLVFCGGEMKRIVTQRLLNPHGIGAFSVTASEGTWERGWQGLLEGKSIWICFDIDNAGSVATRRVATFMQRAAKSVFNMTDVLRANMDLTQHPKGDINDYVGRMGKTDLLRLVEESKEWVGSSVGGPKAPDEIHDIPLAAATHPNFINRRVRFQAVAVALDPEPYIIPRRIGVSCTQDQKVCPICPIYGTEVDPDTGYADFEIPPTSLGILQMVNTPLSKQGEAIKSSLGIPPCRVVLFQTRAHYRVHDLRLTPQISIRHDSGANTLQSAYVLDREMEMNTPYTVTAVAHPHPKNQQAVLLVEDADESEDNLDSFSPSDSDLGALAIFRPNDWSDEALRQKLDEVYSDIEANVTRIFQRRDLHLLLDLTYHSVSVFRFEGRDVPGWVNSAVVGDSGQGKSETANQLINHYGLGERVDCKNATVAGLLGGLQQIGTRWFVSWGVIPTHDRRLVIMEEAKGCSIEVIGKLTDMRSRGVAEIPKIERRRAHARTRLCFLSNPRSSRPMASFAFGLEAIKELMGQLEDVRRFDIAIIVSASQIDSTQINKLMRNRPNIPHVFTAEICRRLVLYAWTRKPEDIILSGEALDQIFEGAVRLCSKFSEAMPLIDRGTTRFKISRLAIALAIRTWSVDDGKVIIRPCHVRYVVEMIDRIYSDPVFGYEDYSKARSAADNIRDPKLVTRKITATKYPSDFVHQLLYRDDINLVDMMDWLEVDREIAQAFLSFFVRKHCLYRDQHRNYVKNPDFIKLLKELESQELTTMPEPGDVM